MEWNLTVSGLAFLWMTSVVYVPFAGCFITIIIMLLNVSNQCLEHLWLLMVVNWNLCLRLCQSDHKSLCLNMV